MTFRKPVQAIQNAVCLDFIKLILILNLAHLYSIEDLYGLFNAD